MADKTTSDQPLGFATLLSRIAALERRLTMLESRGRHPERDRSRSFSEMIAEAAQEQAGRCIP